VLIESTAGVTSGLVCFADSSLRCIVTDCIGTRLLGAELSVLYSGYADIKMPRGLAVKTVFMRESVQMDAAFNAIVSLRPPQLRRWADLT
jgi:phosphoribosylcarboxyaminoimidazole (NCAIR) mutase